MLLCVARCITASDPRITSRTEEHFTQPLDGGVLVLDKSDEGEKGVEHAFEKREIALAQVALFKASDERSDLIRLCRCRVLIVLHDE